MLHALAFVVLAVVITLAAATAAFLLARRMIRRRWRRLGGPEAARVALAGWSLVSAWRERSGARTTPEQMSAGPVTRVRRRMWNAVDHAQDAVRHADALDAPVGELPAVCRTLRSAATELDALLKIERRLPGDVERSGPVRRQVADLIRAAHDVQSVALQSCSDVTGTQIGSLVRDARDEVEIVAAALSRLRSLSPRPR
jgi:hypothetical protein